MVETYTEAKHVVFGIGPEEIGQPDPIDMQEPSGTKFMHPDAVTLTYYWRTQVGDTAWDAGSAEVVGEVHEGGVSTGQRSTVLIGAGFAPEWVADLLKRHAPTGPQVPAN